MLAIGLALIVGESKAANTQAAIAVVESSIDQLDAIIASGRPSSEISDGIESLFKENLDAVYMARAVLGPPWRTATASQRAAFTRVFRRYLAEKYSRYFRKFNGATYTVRSARTTRNENSYEVVTTMHVQNKEPTRVYWHLFETKHGPKIRNLIVDEWNLLALEKTVLRNLLRHYNGNLNSLIRVLPRRYEDR